MARVGYTLPVFAVAAAKAALLHLQNHTDQPIKQVPTTQPETNPKPERESASSTEHQGTSHQPTFNSTLNPTFNSSPLDQPRSSLGHDRPASPKSVDRSANQESLTEVTLNLLLDTDSKTDAKPDSQPGTKEPNAARSTDENQPAKEAKIPIQSVAWLDAHRALAIAISDPGDNLDLTRNTPIWAYVERQAWQGEPLILEAGEGLGQTVSGEPAIYDYARRLFKANLLPFIHQNETIRVSIILPEGRQLARRTSNEAFGVLGGLSLLGTSALSQPLSNEDHLNELRQRLQIAAQERSQLIFCIGSHGRNVAERLGLPTAAIVQTGNWIGALLVEAALREVKSVLLLGYQGKLIKLAGGIFNTSSHLADAKLEIMGAAVAHVGGSIEAVRAVLAATSADHAYKLLIDLGLAVPVFSSLADLISQKSQTYVQKYADRSLVIGTVLFDRQGQLITKTAIASDIMDEIRQG